MAGQAQLLNYNINSLFNKYNQILMNQVKFNYIKTHFNITTEYSEKEALNAYLHTKLYKSKYCEVLDFIDKSIRGALGDENIDIVDLKTMQTKYRDINNYYYTSPTWESESW